MNFQSKPKQKLNQINYNFDHMATIRKTMYINPRKYCKGNPL